MERQSSCFETGNKMSTTYQAALEAANTATDTFHKARDAYRARTIGDTEYLSARAEHNKAKATFDIAFADESNR